MDTHAAHPPGKDVFDPFCYFAAVVDAVVVVTAAAENTCVFYR